MGKIFLNFNKISQIHTRKIEIFKKNPNFYIFFGKNKEPQNLVPKRNTTIVVLGSNFFFQHIQNFFPFFSVNSTNFAWFMGYSFFLYQNFFIKKKAHGNQYFLYGVRFCPKSPKKKLTISLVICHHLFSKKNPKKKWPDIYFNLQ